MGRNIKTKFDRKVWQSRSMYFIVKILQNNGRNSWLEVSPCGPFELYARSTLIKTLDLSVETCSADILSKTFSCLVLVLVDNSVTMQRVIYKFYLSVATHWWFTCFRGFNVAQTICTSARGNLTSDDEFLTLCQYIK